jgi:hypothetical protein
MQRGRHHTQHGWFWAGVAEKLTPSALVVVIATLGYQVYRHDLSDAIASAVGAAQKSIDAVAESIGGALGIFNANQQEMMLQLRQIAAEHQSDRSRIDRIESKMDRASNAP